MRREKVQGAKSISSIRQHIDTIPSGEVFTSREFSGMGTRAAIDQALSRLVKAGHIDRVARGVFVKPKQSPYVGKVPPSPAEVVAAIAKYQGVRVEVSGAEALRYFGLTTQVPVRPVFNTTGNPRRFKMGNLEVTMRTKRPRKLHLAGTLAGKALAALWYLGKDHVTPAIISQIEAKLPTDEFAELVASTSHMPGWMADAFRRYQEAQA
jgi:hypothetical protein